MDQRADVADEGVGAGSGAEGGGEAGFGGFEGLETGDVDAGGVGAAHCCGP